MGNVESGPEEGSRGPVGSLKHRLHSLEETIRSIEEAHQDAHGHHFPCPDSADVYTYGARLICRPGVRVLVGPIIGEVTSNSAVILLEVDIAPGLGPTASVSCHVSLADDACPRGRVVASATLQFPSRRPRAFRIGGDSGSGCLEALRPGKTYTACFGGVCAGDARSRVGRFVEQSFRTPSACFEPRLQVVAISEDRPDRLPPGELSLWRVLRERIAMSRAHPASAGGSSRGIDVVVHTGGQAWMGDAFDDARELLRRRAQEPMLCAEGGWREAQEEATERLRNAVRRAWNLRDKRAVLSSVSNLMLCGETDVHPDLAGDLAHISSFTRGNASRGGGDGRRSDAKRGGSTATRHKEGTRALDATVRACRRVWCEYQGQLLWKAVAAPGRERGAPSEEERLAEMFEAEEGGVEEALADTRRAERDVAIKERKVAIADEAFRRAKAAGTLPAEVGRKAAADKIEGMRKDLKAARSKQNALARRTVSPAVSAAADRASRGGFLNLGGSIGLILLDTLWQRVRWDGGISASGRGTSENIESTGDESSQRTRLISPRVWDCLDLELSRDSELRLLVVFVRVSRRQEKNMRAEMLFRQRKFLPEALSLELGNGKFNAGRGAAGDFDPWISAEEVVRVDEKGTEVTSSTSVDSHPSDDRIRLLDRLFAWKSGEVWREVLLVCGACTVPGGTQGALCSACELEILDSKRPECSIRQVITGPVTDNPGPGLVDTLEERTSIPVVSPGSTDEDWRFAYRLASAAADDMSANSDEKDDESDDDIATKSTPGVARQQEVVTSSSDARSRLPVATGASDIPPAVGTAPAKTEVKRSLEGENVKKAPGWESKAVTANNQNVSSHAAAVTPEEASLQQPVSASRERSYIEVMLDAGMSPAAAAAAGRDPAESAWGLCASAVAKAVTVPFVGVTVVLGPVIGRVTQGSAVVLVEVGSKAPVACVLMDGVSGGQHRQMRMLYPGRPHAFFFDTLEENRYYTVTLDGVENGDARTGAFTTLKAWADRRAPVAWRAAERFSGTDASPFAEATERSSPAANGDEPAEQPDGITNQRSDLPNGEGDDVASCDVRLLFVSGTGLANETPRSAAGWGERDGVATTVQGNSRAAAEDFWAAIGREMWGPWPQADVVVHTGSQVNLEVAVLEALPILSAVEMEEEGSLAREDAEHMVMERIRDAYRFQWSLPGARTCLSCGSHLMLRGEADLALPQLKPHPTSQNLDNGSGRGLPGGGKLLGRHVSSYARITIARLASQAFDDYQRQLWDPQSVPIGLDMNDVGYARGGAEIDGPRAGRKDVGAGAERVDWAGRRVGDGTQGGEWHFHAFGETVGLFALDVQEGSSRLQRDERAPLLSDGQWASLAAALRIDEICAMVVVGDIPFMTDSIHDARAKARNPSHAHLRRSWPFHGGELLRLLEMLVAWKSAGAVGGEPREVILVGGGLHPLKSVIRHAAASITFSQVVCGPFAGARRAEDARFEPTGQLSRHLSYRHENVDNNPQHNSHEGRNSPSLTPSERGLVFSSDHNHDSSNGYRHPSCVLVRCNVRGAMERTFLELRSRHFTPAEWTAWCDDSERRLSEATDTSAPPLPSPPPPPDVAGAELHTAAIRPVEFGRPREGPRYAETAGEEAANAKEKRDYALDLNAAALLGESGSAAVLHEAFERVLDMGSTADEQGEAAVAGTGFFLDATKRAFECISFAYDHENCRRMRARCPVRPSPIVVRRFLLSVRQRRQERDTQGQAAPQKTETTKNVGEGSKKGRKPKTGRDGVPSLLCTLPFHDNESFAEFFCEVLRASERLARRGF